MPDLEQQIRTGFDSERAEEIRHLNEKIKWLRDALDYASRKRAELLGRTEDIFAVSPELEQPGLDRLLDELEAAA